MIYSILKMRTLIVFAVLTSLTSFGQQIGPGGVGSISEIQVWLDASEITASNGDLLPSWTDVSGNGNDASASGAGIPTYQSSNSDFNNRPCVNFSTNDFMDVGAVSAFNTNTLTWITTSKYNGANNKVLLRSQYVSGAGTLGSRTYLGTNVSTYFRVYTRKPSNVQAGVGFGKTSVPEIILGSWDGVGLSAFRNGQFAGRGLVTSNPGGHQKVRIGANTVPTGSHFNGQMPEVILYSIGLNDAQSIIVSNYLSTKYARVMTDNDFYNNEATHPEDVIGIGREDASNQHLSARGKGIVEVTSSGLDDGDYMLIGHDDQSIVGVTSSDLPPIYSTFSPIGKRFFRTWRATETGETGDLTFTFDLTNHGFGNTGNYEMLIDTDNSGTFDDSERFFGVYNTPTNSMVFTILAADIQDGNMFTLANTDGTITSIVSLQNWNDPSTWNCNCVPDITDDVLIDDGHTVNVTDHQGALNLEVNPTGVLRVTGAGYFDVAGVFNGIGTTVFADGSTLRFMGSILQTPTFNGLIELSNLTIDNDAGVTFTAGSFTLSGLLRPDAGVADFSAVNLTITSDATQTGRVGVYGASADVVGNIRVQRFMPAGVAGNRNICAPFTSGFELNEWDPSIFISGPGATFDDGCSQGPTGCFASITYWNANTQAYKSVTNLDSAVNHRNGLEVFLGDNLTSFNGATLEGNGALAPSLIDYSCVPGWNFIGNPFACPIDMDECFFSAAMGNYHYVFDPSTNSFQFWDGIAQVASTSELDNGLLSSGQGFWVFNNAASPALLRVYQTAKDTVSSDAILKMNKPNFSNYLRMELKSKNSRSQCISEVKIDFQSEMLELENVEKLSNLKFGGVDLYSKSVSGRDCRFNKVNVDYLEINELLIYTDVSEDGEYSISFSGANLDQQYDGLSLRDLETDEIYCLDKVNLVKFITRVDKNGTARFALFYNDECNKLDDEIEDDNGLNVYSLGNGELNILIESDNELSKAIVNVYDVLGKKLYSNDVSFNRTYSSTIQLGDVSSQIIIVEVISNGNVFVKKVLR